MNRGDAVGELYDAQKLERVLDAAQRQGVGVMRGEEADRLLKSIGAEAAYWPQEGAPGTLILPSNPTRSMVLEELLHYGQYKRAGFPSSNPATGGHIQGLEFEIQAQQRLGSLAQSRGWSATEIQHFQTAEAEWQRLLNQAIREGR